MNEQYWRMRQTALRITPDDLFRAVVPDDATRRLVAEVRSRQRDLSWMEVVEVLRSEGHTVDNGQVRGAFEGL
jgi:hypothetical protein